MSHYATLTVKALDDVKPALVSKALKRMNKGYTVEMLSKHPTIPSFGANNAVVMLDGAPTNIRMNFTQKENKISLSVAGEFYRQKTTLDDFVNSLKNQYSQLKIEEYAKAQNMTPLKRTVKENGDVVLRFRIAG